MANPEHLAILNQGVETWNQWRRRPRPITNEPILSLLEVDLSGSDLSSMVLNGALLYQADLSRARLRHSQMFSAQFSFSNLIEADLSESALLGVNFRRADLRGANLTRAGLNDADLTDAKLAFADFTGSQICATTFANTNLSQAENLEAVVHMGPSSVGIDTIYRSGGAIPEVFLRGCGVPENFIEFSRSLVAQAIEFYSCFVSYSSKDQEFVERLHADLQSHGVRCWFAPEDLRIGDPFRQRIDEAVRFREKLLIVLSQHSVQSPWVEKEVEAAFEEERRRKTIVIFPIRLDDAVMETDHAWAADIRRTRHIGDFTKRGEQDAYQRAFNRLLRDLTLEEARTAKGHGYGKP